MRLETSILAALASVTLAIALSASCSDEPADPCAPVTCSGHGSCDLRQDEVRCLCEPAFYVTDSGLECSPRVADGDGDTDADGDADRHRLVLRHPVRVERGVPLRAHLS